MSLGIGINRDSDLPDPLRAMRDCHRRIEGLLAELRSIAEQAGGCLSEERRHELDTALRRLLGVAMRHTADEEDSLFPRLRRRKDSRVLPVLALIESLEEEHLCADRIHSEVNALGRMWLLRGALPRGTASRLVDLIGHLHHVYRHHMAIEEGEVFPIAAAALSDSDLQAIGSEMASRRGRTNA